MSDYLSLYPPICTCGHYGSLHFDGTEQCLHFTCPCLAFESIRAKMTDVEQAREDGASLQPRLPLCRAVEALLNSYACERGSDTPDFVLAEYLLASLAAFNRAVVARETWYGRAAGSRAEGSALEGHMHRVLRVHGRVPDVVG
jgi:hypothetical protein